MNSVMKDGQRLPDVEKLAADAGGERRDGLRFIVTGTVLFLFAGAPRELPARTGNGAVTVMSFKTWTPRGGEVWCEARSAEHIALLRGLVEGTQLRVAGQLVTKARRLGGQYATVRCFEIERV